ncbi:heme exporter protein CcmD [Variovorax saccharolyticus]|nr:heme exporter protein CcmD [Variovorax sp. J22R187]MDM0018128.1 heme exporter protein CcmD [Variovorax sp. J22R187]
MNGSSHGLYILAAYGVALVLIVAEVWSLVRRSRAQARALPPEARDEA